jgi:hypothetical protein
VWPRIAGAQTAAEVRHVLTGSRWGDPGAEDRVTVGLALRLAWARRMIESVPEAADWAAGAVGLLLARELFLAGRSAENLIAFRAAGVGASWPQGSNMRSFRELMPVGAAWALADVEAPAELWRGEAAWWRRVEHDGQRLVHDPHLGRSAVIGSIALLGVDAWRTAAALASAARRATGAFEEIV